ncbi:hypothetical protein BJ138DRAFT_258863 [Hygrophoropsis aurantiaca]|uniref:Uncharacterized protein n=1 Tax=Hygrophoropsis aurantiaca TaxID=72124 RepID=A0ACB8A7I3_9AGAM|nr:hypothetical protein BJ138DRAFT_258863 [Hygrophoropsis aurantiaca]
MSDDHQSDEPVALVEPPFDALDADIVLRSSDGADIRTHKFILSYISPVFRTMLSLPRPSEESTISPSPSTLATITMEENRNTLQKLLRPCYPGFDISLDSLGDIKLVINAATKYDMQSVLGSLKKWIVTSSIFQTNPLAFYAISCRQGWEAEVRISAEKVLEVMDFNPGASQYVPELEDISGGTYYRLVAYHAQCGAVAKATADVQDLKLFDVQFFGKHECPTGDSRPSCLVSLEVDVGSAGKRYYKFPNWILTYLNNIGEELLLRPCASTVMKSGFFEKAVLDGSRCNYCRRVVITKLSQTRGVFAARVAEVVSQVQLEFVPPTP